MTNVCVVYDSYYMNHECDNDRISVGYKSRFGHQLCLHNEVHSQIHNFHESVSLEQLHTLKKIKMGEKSETQKNTRVIYGLWIFKFTKLWFSFKSFLWYISSMSHFDDSFLWEISWKYQITNKQSELVYKDDQSHFIHREKWRVFIFMESIKMNSICRITNSVAQTELQSKDW